MLKTIATVIAIFSSAFIFLPAGRDVVSYNTFLLPGEENVRPMMTMTGESTRFWMWGMWGLNHCFMSLFKIIATLREDKTMLKLLSTSVIITSYYCIVGQQEHGDMEGFIVICAIQTLSLGYLGFVDDSKPKQPKLNKD